MAKRIRQQRPHQLVARVEKKQTEKEQEIAWGVGNQKDAKAFDTTTLGSSPETAKPLDLINGEHPHSDRQYNTYARTPDGEIYAFDGHRVLVDVSIHSYNYLKESYYSGDEVRKGGRAIISFDGDVVYGFFFREPERALMRAAQLIEQLYEHSANIVYKKGREALKGRPIYYHSTPAHITNVDWENGEVFIETVDEVDIPLSAWQLEDLKAGEATLADTERWNATWADLFDKHIWWWRREDKKEEPPA